MTLFNREAAITILEKAKGYPIITITGPRQAGKTTLAKMTFSNKIYCSLEDLDQRQFATEDPRRFLAQFPDGAILDEIQYCPHLFSYLQTIVDGDKRTALFILTGSQQFNLVEKISQSLAGRVGLIHLLPFSMQELAEHNALPVDLETMLFQGGYPPLYYRQVSNQHWYSDYVATYLERDVRQLLNVKDLNTFHRFIKMCAARSGQLLNLSNLANDCGITHNTANAWITILEASYIIFRLHPYYQNFNKRLTKSSKLYFYDTGLLCFLLGIHHASQLTHYNLRGAIFETWIVSEFIKHQFNHSYPSNLFFWRDQHGHEIDVLIEFHDKQLPIEIKSGETINPDFFQNLKYWQKVSNQSDTVLIYAGQQKQSREHTQVIPWRGLNEFLKNTYA